MVILILLLLHTSKYYCTSKYYDITTNYDYDYTSQCSSSGTYFEVVLLSKVLHKLRDCKIWHRATYQICSENKEITMKIF